MDTHYAPMKAKLHDTGLLAEIISTVASSSEEESSIFRYVGKELSSRSYNSVPRAFISDDSMECVGEKPAEGATRMKSYTLFAQI